MKKLSGIIIFLWFLTIPVLLEASDTFDTHFDKGLTYYKKKNFKLALNEFDAASKIDPKISKAYYYMGYAEDKKKNTCNNCHQGPINEGSRGTNSLPEDASYNTCWQSCNTY